MVLVQFASKVGPEDEQKLPEEAEDERAVDILLGGCEEEDVALSDVEQRRVVQDGNGRACVATSNSLKPEDVCYVATESRGEGKDSFHSKF